MNLSQDRAHDASHEKKSSGGFFSNFYFFGRSASNQSPSNKQPQQQAKSESTFAPKLQNVVQVYLDLDFKQYLSIELQEEQTVQELSKLLKQKLGNAVTAAPNSARESTNRSTYGSQLSRSTDKGGSSSRDEYTLYLANVKPFFHVLFLRKLIPQEMVKRVYRKAQELNRNVERGKEKFKLLFSKQCDIEYYLKENKNFQAQYQTLNRNSGSFTYSFDEENKLASHLGRSILNNTTYERKGKLLKKSLNSDKFKERQFLLDKDQLFYYKAQNKKEINFNVIMLGKAKINILENYGKQKYCFQIENENRKYVLATKQQYDLEQWVYAIQAQISLSRENKHTADVNQQIFLREKEIAASDMILIQKIFKPKNVIVNPVQQHLLDFIKDKFIQELLPNITKYISLAREPAHQKHAFNKANEIAMILGGHVQKLQNSIGTIEQIKEYEQQNQENYRRYKELQTKPEDQILCLFSVEEYQDIQQELDNIRKQQIEGEASDQQPEIQMNQKLFNNILLKISKVIRHNYLEDFYMQKSNDLLSIPTNLYKSQLPSLEFNSIGPDIKRQTSKNINIFTLLSQKQNGGSQEYQSQMSSRSSNVSMMMQQ